jgi:hypothetical protein
MKQTKRGGLDPTANHYCNNGHVPLVVEFVMLNFLVALATDGVVIDPNILPSAASYPYNLGRTAS